MWRALCFYLVLPFTIACYLTPVLIWIADGLGPGRVVFWNPDYSSTGIYFRGERYVHVRHRGYGPDVDGDHRYDLPLLTLLLAAPPITWVVVNGDRATRGAAKVFAVACAGCPVVLALTNLYLRRDDGSPLCFAAICIPAVLIWFITAVRRPRMSGGMRRLSKGLCPQCGYDLRATPDRCPECGNAPAYPIIRS